MAAPSSISTPVGYLARLCQEGPSRKLLTHAVDSLAGELDCERVFLFQLRPQGGFRVLVARSRDRETLLHPSSRISHYAVGKMVRTEKLLLVPDALRDRRYRPEEVLSGRRAPASILVIPLRFDGSVRGGIYADHRFQPLRLDSRRSERIEAWVHAAALSLWLRQASRDIRRGRKARESRAEEQRSQNEREGEAWTRSSEPLMAAQRSPEVETFHDLISANPDLRDVFDAVRSMERSDLPVLIYGATGTGKTLLAAAVHKSSVRRGKPFVSIDPATIPEDLIESELFGYARGAFTGAEIDKQGALVLADGGTLFLDEVADTGLELQKKLLRVLEDGEVRPLGARTTVRVDVRLISATSRDLEKLARQGKFRRELYFRLKGVVLEIPSLAERREDILPLALHFLDKHARKEGRTPPSLAEPARLKLLSYGWPGNVRELENEMRRLVAMGFQTVDANHLAPFIRGRQRRPYTSLSAPESTSTTLSEVVRQAEEDALRSALAQAGGNKSEAALSLGITRKALYRRLAKYGL